MQRINLVYFALCLTSLHRIAHARCIFVICSYADDSPAKSRSRALTNKERLHYMLIMTARTSISTVVLTVYIANTRGILRGLDTTLSHTHTHTHTCIYIYTRTTTLTVSRRTKKCNYSFFLYTTIFFIYFYKDSNFYYM